MNWQEWVVGLLIVLCVARILYGIYLFFRRVKENDNPCASCASGCELNSSSRCWIPKRENRCRTESAESSSLRR